MAILNRISHEMLSALKREAAHGDAETSESEGFSLPVREWLNQSEDVVKKYPGISLLAALGTGILIGWLVKRT